MEVYIGLVMILSFMVDFLLLLGTNRLCGYPPGYKRVLLAAATGCVYSGVCLIPGFRFLGSALWRFVSIGLLGWIAFGWSKSAIRRSTVFVLLCMAMGGIAVGIGGNSFWTLLLSAAVLLVLCTVGLRDGRVGSASYIPVELSYRGKLLHLTALQDTGNTLRDPVTGRPVLVVGADVAGELLGLTREQLRRPAETISGGIVPGLRLVPYRTIGHPSGLLLALRLPEVKIGAWKGTSLVAFAPEILGSEGVYQALTGGVV